MFYDFVLFAPPTPRLFLKATHACHCASFDIISLFPDFFTISCFPGHSHLGRPGVRQITAFGGLPRLQILLPIHQIKLFIIARRFEGPKVMTVTGMATPTPAIQVTVSIFHNCNKIQGSRSDDSYRDGDADPHDTPTPTVPVTVDTFHNCKKIRGSKSDDSYRDGDANPHDPCDCSCFS